MNTDPNTMKKVPTMLVIIKVSIVHTIHLNKKSITYCISAVNPSSNKKEQIGFKSS
jgi:hypothetical protein